MLYLSIKMRGLKLHTNSLISNMFTHTFEKIFKEIINHLYQGKKKQHATKFATRNFEKIFKEIIKNLQNHVDR